MSYKVIIICPSIPPNPGIGGRRWAKFSKYLDRSGKDVTVVGFKFRRERAESNWSVDMSELSSKGKVHFIPHNFSETLKSAPKNIADKLLFRIHLWRDMLRFKGNYRDPSILWYKTLIPFLIRQIGTTPTTIIATGAPFTYLHDLLIFKEYPHVKLVADFRDPWVNNKISYGYKQLSIKRFNHEQKLELAVFKGFDLLLNVYQEQVNYTNERIGDSSKNILLPNGFDQDDLNGIITDKKAQDSKRIKFIFGGTLYNDAIYAFELLIHHLNLIKTQSPDIYNKLEFSFYGSHPTAISHHFTGSHSKVLFDRGRVSLKEMYQNIYESDFVMIFLTKAMNYTRNTKFLECINLNKKILVFSNEGYLEKHVSDNRIGYSMTKSNIQSSFDQLFNDYNRNQNLCIPDNYDISEYNIENLTNKLIDLIDNLDHDLPLNE